MLKETVITHDGIDRCYKICKCARCGSVHRCTPLKDFIAIDNDEKGLLYCETCYYTEFKERQTAKISSST